MKNNLINFFQIFFLVIFLSSYIDSKEKPTVEIDLVSAEKLALNNNFTIKNHLDQKRILYRVKKEQWRNFWPVFSVSYNQNVEVAERSSDSRSNEIELGVQQPIYDGGRTALSHEIAKLDIVINQNEYEILKNETISELRVKFFTLLHLKENLRIQKKSLERSQIQLDLNEKEYKLGMQTKIDYLEVFGDIKQIEVEYINALREYDLAILDLKQFLGLEKDVALKVKVKSIFDFHIKENKHSLEKLFAISKEKRPEVFQSSVTLMKARKEYLMAKRHYLPTVSLTANYNLSGDQNPPLQRGWGVGIVISANLYGSSTSTNNSLNSSNNYKSRGYSSQNSVNILDDISYVRQKYEAQLEYKKSRFEKNDLMKSIYIEVKKAFNAVNLNYRLYSIANERSKLVWERLLIEIKKTELGQMKRVDLMETELEYLKAALSETQAKTDYLLSVNTLENTIGVSPDFLDLIEYRENNHD